jgi:hypothetical protein
MFAVYNKVKPDTENTTGLNFTVVKLTSLQITKQPLCHKIRKLGTIYSVKPVLTRGLAYSAKGRIFSNTLCARDTYT